MSLSAPGVVIDKMFSVSRLWDGISPYMTKVISVIWGGTSRVASKARRIHNISQKLSRISHHHGSLLTVKWLKACHVCLQRYLGDDKMCSLRDLDPELPLPRLINGLPGIIPRGDRNLIRNRHIKTVQFWLTVFSLYRVIECEFKPKLSTITDAFTGDQVQSEKFLQFIDNSPFANFFKSLEGYEKWVTSIKLGQISPLVIHSASPTNSISWHGLLTDAYLLRSNPELLAYFFEYCKRSGSTGLWKSLLEAYQLVLLGAKHLKIDLYVPKGADGRPHGFVPCSKGSWSGFLGQLSFKEEAAGKLRIFAIVDSWTQSLLRPLHDSLFDLLKRIPNDGTFNQDESVARSMSKALKSNCSWSYDLTAATDRLPIIFQSALLDRIIPRKLGNSWAGLLVCRDYSYNLKNYSGDIGKVRYAVGQPMGALSSWAMLALTHHFLLQYSSFLVGKRGWNEDYEILGDDLVIFDPLLASKYLEVMKMIGMDINLSKSISSPSTGSFEFAKRMVVNNTNVSAISLKQFISERSVGARVANVLYFARLGLIRSNSVLSILLSRFGKVRDLKDLYIPSLSLLGSLFKSKRITLKDIFTVLINIDDDEFSWEDSPVKIPIQSLLTEEKALLNVPDHKLTLRDSDTRDEYYKEMRGDIAAIVLQTALAKAKGFENKWNDLSFGHFLFGSYPEAYFKLDPLFRVQVDGWLHNAIMAYESFDPTELLEEIEATLYEHAKHNHVSVEDALVYLDRIESAIRRWDIKEPSKVEHSGLVSPIFGYLIRSFKGGTGLGYMMDRRLLADEA